MTVSRKQSGREWHEGINLGRMSSVLVRAAKQGLELSDNDAVTACLRRHSFSEDLIGTLSLDAAKLAKCALEAR